MIPKTPQAHNHLVVILLAALVSFVAACRPVNCPKCHAEPCGNTSSSSGGSTGGGTGGSAGGGACAMDCDSSAVQKTKACIAAITTPAGPDREAEINGCCRRIPEDPEACPASNNCINECKPSQ